MSNNKLLENADSLRDIVNFHLDITRGGLYRNDPDSFEEHTNRIDGEVHSIIEDGLSRGLINPELMEGIYPKGNDNVSIMKYYKTLSRNVYRQIEHTERTGEQKQAATLSAHLSP